MKTILSQYIKKYRFDIVLATVYSVLNKCFDVLPELLIGLAVDVVVKQENSYLAQIGIVNIQSQIVYLGIATGCIWILESTFQYLYSLKWCYLAQTIQDDLRLDCYSHLQKLDMEYFSNQSTGNLISICNDDINQLERFINDGVNQIIQIIASTVLIGGVFFIISTKLAIYSFAPIPLIFIGMMVFRKKLSPLYLNVRNAAGFMAKQLHNNITGIATIKMSVAENYALEQIKTCSTSYKNANNKAILLSAAVIPIIRMAVMSGFLSALIYGGFLTISGELEVSQYSILIFLSQRLLWPLTYLGAVVDLYQRSKAAMTRIINLLSLEYKENIGSIVTSSVISVEFIDIRFSYPTRKTLFNNLSFAIPAGAKIAFVGSTGSGKSSILKLILGLYKAESGDILINQNKIELLSMPHLRQAIAIVEQDFFIIDGTVAENIKYGCFSATDQDMQNAAIVAEADRFIQNLPDKYNTVIGERGQKLSGGQCQRIALARAVIKNPSLLILDEATSAVDTETELLIQNAIEKIECTTIIIAHRLSTVVNVDCIYVLRNGQILESGHHEKLITNNSQYANMWNAQNTM